MLAADDAAVAARDAALPGLRLLFDADAVAEALAGAFPTLGVTGATASYVRLKRGTSCLVGYRVDTGSTGIDAYLRTHADPGDPKLGKIVGGARQRAGVGGRPASALLGRATLAVLHPHDHELPALARLADPARRPPLLAQALGIVADIPVEQWTLTPMRYKPERRWVALLTDHTGNPMLLKVQRQEACRRAIAGARAFAAVPVPAAALLGKSRRHGLTVQQWVQGDPAAESLGAADVPATGTAADIGALLAQVHAITATTRPADAGADHGEPQALGAAIAAITALDPAAGDRAAGIATGLPALEAEQGSVRRCLIHGDCSIDQIILTPGGPVLIDLDRAGYGDPHSDLAQLLADLAMRAATRGLRGDGDLAEAILEGYTAAGGIFDRQRLAALTAARLVRLAPEPFRQRRGSWRHQLHAILDRAVGAARDGVAA